MICIFSAVVQATQTSGRLPRQGLNLEEDPPGLLWLLVAQWVPLGWEDPGDLWEVQEAQEDLQGQCFRQDIDLMVQDQVDPLEVQTVGVHQVAGLQVHLEMLHGKMEVIQTSVYGYLIHDLRTQNLGHIRGGYFSIPMLLLPLGLPL